MEYLGLAARGFCMGAADIVPGVSGGTMAFILGIYEELIQAIHTLNLDFVRRLVRGQWREAFDHFAWPFLLAVGLGIGTAIFTLARGIRWALHHHPSLVWAFFFGLVLASVVTVRKRVARWTGANLLAAGLAMLGAYWLVGLLPVRTPDAPWFLFLSGALAICAMILPGISGAFILVLLGKYQTVLEAVVQRDVITLGLVAAGAAVGLMSFARLLRWLLRRYHDLTVAMLTGLMLGSLRKVWPWKETLVLGSGVAHEVEVNVLPGAFTPEVGLAVGLAMLGMVLVLGLDRLTAESRVSPSAEPASPLR
jgi:putative membrane protein